MVTPAQQVLKKQNKNFCPEEIVWWLLLVKLYDVRGVDLEVLSYFDLFIHHLIWAYFIMFCHYFINKKNLLFLGGILPRFLYRGCS